MLFLYAQHQQNTQLFVSFFDKFNKRYDDLNEKLNAIVDRDKDVLLQKCEIDVLYDYFNLCGEEYLYYKAGYIDREVWLSWVCGMRHFARHPSIGRFWEEELKIQAEAYYGFSLDLLEDCPNRLN